MHRDDHENHAGYSAIMMHHHHCNAINKEMITELLLTNTKFCLH